MRRWRADAGRVLVVFAFVLVLLGAAAPRGLAGAARDSPGNRSTRRVVACDLISASEAQSLVPYPVHPAVLNPGVDPTSICIYSGPPPGAQDVWVRLLYQGPAARQAFLADRTATEHNTVPGSVIESIAGVGEDAYHYRHLNASDRSGAVVVLKGDFVVETSVQIGNSVDSDNLAKETSLAKLVVSRLPAAPVTRTAKKPERSSLPGSFPDPTKVDTSAKALGASAGLTGLLMLMLAFPSELFDRTLKSHYRTVRGWFGPFARLDQRVAATIRAWPQWVGFSTFMIVGGLLAALLDPTLDWNVASLALVLGLVASRAVITVAFALPEMIFMRRRHRLHGRFEALPGALAVAAVCVLVSRLAGFQPGYLYGVIVGIEFGRKLSRAEEGRVAAWAAVWVLGLSVGAWFAWIPVVNAIGGGDTSFPILFVDALLATIFVIGIETVVIGLLPLQLLKGEALLAWSRRTWTALYALGAFLFVWVLVHPESDFVGTTHETGQVTRAMVPFLFYGTLSIGLWLYLRNRPLSPLDTDASAAAPADDEAR